MKELLGHKFVLNNRGFRFGTTRPDVTTKRTIYRTSIIDIDLYIYEVTKKKDFAILVVEDSEVVTLFSAEEVIDFIEARIKCLVQENC